VNISLQRTEIAQGTRNQISHYTQAEGDFAIADRITVLRDGRIIQQDLLPSDTVFPGFHA
jgi:ABC-type sugar transport system ATPase subunit